MTAPDMPRTVTGVAGVLGLVGQALGTSELITVDQSTVDAFAQVTGDDHWSHVDQARAAGEAPAGSTIAHGLLTLSLHPACLYRMVEFRGFRGIFNYGYDRVRFPAPVVVGSRVRVTATVTAAERIDDDVRATIRFVFESDTSDKAVCVTDYVQYFMV